MLILLTYWSTSWRMNPYSYYQNSNQPENLLQVSTTTLSRLCQPFLSRLCDDLNFFIWLSRWIRASRLHETSIQARIWSSGYFMHMQLSAIWISSSRAFSGVFSSTKWVTWMSMTAALVRTLLVNSARSFTFISSQFFSKLTNARLLSRSNIFSNNYIFYPNILQPETNTLIIYPTTIIQFGQGLRSKLMIVEALLIGLAVYVGLVVLLQVRKRRQRGSKGAKKVAFFHPFCNDGGGGEKVLWSMVEALFEKTPPQASTQSYKDEPIINIYSLQNDSHQILTKVSNRFNIKLSQYAHRLHFIHIPGRSLLTPKPKLTMLCHIFLPMLYCFKCLWRYQPDIFYDTTGFAFNFFVVKLLLPWTQCRAYVHYPFISQDMIDKVREGRVDFNNDVRISRSKWKTWAKLVYYKAILFMYKLVRFTVKQAQANSSWTQAHMQKIWGPSVTKLYPPCTLTQLLKFTKNYSQQPFKIISLAQFRPQKNHVLQINVIQNLLETLKSQNRDPQIHLYICGTTRGPEDQKLLSALQGKVSLQKLQPYITFCVNMKFPQLMQKLKECQYGIHSMEAEHFGISVVEMLAAGCLIVAHNSAGPKLDIIKDARFLAESQKEYEEKLYAIMEMKDEEKKRISDEFRARMGEFGEVSFKENFRAVFEGGDVKSQ